jgi:hypothetical protein
VAAVERLAGLVTHERMRWRDLMWMLISWTLRRRPRVEREALVAAALEHQADSNSRREVDSMSTTLEQTLEEWAEQRGIERGRELGRLDASRRLLARLLERRFGTLPDQLRQRIDRIDDLSRLEQAILLCPDFRCLDELEL